MKSMMAYNPLVKPLCSPKETGFRTWDCRTLSSKVKEVKSTMKPFDWLESNIDYGRNLVNSGVEGALSARQKSLGEAPVSSVLIEAVRGLDAGGGRGLCRFAGRNSRKQAQAQLWRDCWSRLTGSRDRGCHRHGLGHPAFDRRYGSWSDEEDRRDTGCALAGEEPNSLRLSPVPARTVRRGRGCRQAWCERWSPPRLRPAHTAKALPMKMQSGFFWG